MACGDFSRGFHRYSCPACKTELILPFSCKSRLCLSCYRKKLFGWSVNLSQILYTALKHDHITLTIPGKIRELLFERGFKTESLNKLAARMYQRELKKISGLNEPEWKSGILATVHRSGNGLNFNPHGHIIATRELVNIDTGEIKEVIFIPYKRFRLLWKETVLRYLVRAGILSRGESAIFRKQYQNGFHVYFQPIIGSDNDVLFRTAEYLASGFFHNSQILKVDNEKKTISFKYRSWVDRGTRKKHFSIITMDVNEFMARMLYYLPEQHQKTIRYYGLYASTYRKVRIEKNPEACSWSVGIEYSFEKKPEYCPDCGELMTFDIIYSFQALRVYRNIRKKFILKEWIF